jgi:hypothetical protein
MPNRIETDVDHAGSKGRLAITEVIFPEPAERRVEAESLDLRPFLEETP